MGRTVVVVGGGYGGAAVAKALDQEADVVLVEPKDAFVQNAAALRALVRPEWADNLFFPYDALLDRGRVIRDRAVSVDARGVVLGSGDRVEADYLVLATGSGYPFPFKFSVDHSGDARDRLAATHRELTGAGRVLIAGAGPVGLELAGEIKAVWPDKEVTVVDPATALLPGFEAEMVNDLRRQLDEFGVELLLGTSLDSEPPVEPGVAAPFTVRAGAREISADIWFRAYGVSVDTAYLSEELAGVATPRGHVRVRETLNLDGHDHIYAIGDITDVQEPKMAANAMRHAEVVAENILAQVRGERPGKVYEISPLPFVLLPLGPEAGVGQLPTPDGPLVLGAPGTSEYKGADLFTGRFAALFGLAEAAPEAA
ncbi:NAD(P)/FAD-dependent oxidoreductase [Bailinhaonella thermotolerans]|uniref:NAD(P)/FAD-dependent oxidoreductase n=1 Tax=Bailinhaonella thermotolerans TaxID=1070861 RepID=A0A3A4AYM1_9ACTN|nr:FAD-dependent oxidoreductase [Bailinhaonella thermotolerans]RJL24472.1 NAD(P)/FAD-dependent oxidoreductase [Bailinhaonella thermotolerans]